MNIEAWLPTLVSIMMLGLIVYFIKSNKADNLKAVNGVENAMDDLKDRLEKDEENYLTEKNHGVLCENAHLKLRAHVSAEIKKSSDAIHAAIRELTTAVKNGGGND